VNLYEANRSIAIRNLREYSKQWFGVQEMQITVDGVEEGAGSTQWF
jgi:hypothetical protein